VLLYYCIPLILLEFGDRGMTSDGKWKQIASEKRKALAELIPTEYRVPQHQLPSESQTNVTSWPKESGWFSTEELEITDSTASHILEKVASKTWTSEKVTKAFCKRAAAAQQLVIRSDMYRMM
jgi:amidase